MDLVAPAGPMYQAGTLSGNPLAMTAGIKTLELLKQPGTYERLDTITQRLCAGIPGRRARSWAADQRRPHQRHVRLLPL